MNEKEINEITDYMFLESNPQKADLAFVFGTFHHQEPVDKVYELYCKGLISKIFLSGGKNKRSGENEAEMMNKMLIELGVNSDDIILENKSTNTLENVLLSKQIIEEKVGFNNLKKVVTIVKNYHARRALMTLKKHFPKNLELIPVTYKFFDFDKDNWPESEIGREKVLSEWNKISKYLAQGDIEEI